MSYSEVVETRGKFRVSIHIDEAPSRPDGDFFGTVVHLDRYGRTEVMGHAYSMPAEDYGIGGLWDHYRDMDLMERYLRIYEGIVGFDYFDTQDGKYVNIVMPKDLEIWGWDVDKPETWPYEDPARSNLNEWRAYSEGDVWFWVVEKAVTWTTDDEDVEDDEKTQWEEIDALHGYYGQEWAEQAAREGLDDHAPRPCKVCGKAMKREETYVDGHRTVGPWPWVHEDGDTSHEANGDLR